ncbi:MAG: hypothetical protein ACKO7A_22235, partial [Microcystis sp.]
FTSNFRRRYIMIQVILLESQKNILATSTLIPCSINSDGKDIFLTGNMVRISYNFTPLERLMKWAEEKRSY